jgi:predicted RNA binding protein YcfA (HicA-like mRNA interferase family)
MNRLPSLKPRVVVNALGRGGFSDVRVRGSYYQLFNPTTRRRVTVPYHNRDLTRATLFSVIRPGLTAQEFLELL